MRCFHLMLLLASLLAPAAKAAEPTIQWRVEAGFALFEYAANPDELMQAWVKIGQGDYATWAASRESTPGLVSPFANQIVGPARRSPWNAKTGQYERSYVHPTHTVIRARLVDGAGMCEWQLSGQAALPPRPCGEATRIVDVPLAGATLAVRTQNRSQPEPVAIVIEHKTILALGDSYASGEGNPDIPTVWKADGVQAGQLKWLRTAISSDAQWWDNACHRSFWSSQTLVALKIAASNPHRLVTYLQYSCSGSEVLDGMLTRQLRPPGLDNVCSGQGCDLPSSQLAAAVRDLCPGQTLPVASTSTLAKAIHGVVKAPGHRLYRVESYDKGGLNLVECPSKPVIPDLVLLSIGGNDAGFAQLGAWAIAPARWSSYLVNKLAKGKLVCPAAGQDIRGGCNEPMDWHLARQLDRRLGLLGTAMKQVLPVPPEHVIQSTYPDPMLKSDGGVCGDRDGLNPDNAWYGAAFVAPRLTIGSQSWHFNITEDAPDGDAGEARILSQSTIPQMLTNIDAGIRTNQFVRVDLHKAFTDHGWCDAPETDPPISLPSFAADPSKWHCAASPNAASAACWAAYAPSKRFIRTMNDALLTQASSRGDGHTGAIHPNLGGHATMADLIFESAAGATDWIRKPQGLAGASP